LSLRIYSMTNPLMSNEIINKKALSDEAKEINHFFIDNKNLYLSAIRIIKARLENLVEEYDYTKVRNPVQQIKTRVKTPQNIINKLLKRDLDISVKSAQKNLTDIAGIRVICSYIDDIYKISGFINSQDDLKVHRISDYIKNPKPNGYRSLHLIVSVPVILLDTTEQVKVEIQIRTVGMHFWASLEHELSYKFPKGKNRTVTHELKQCADIIAETDFRMQRLHNQNNISRKDDKRDDITYSPAKILFQNLRHPVFLLKQKLFKNKKF
jgi:putative GTP pyrophosphokinase